MAEIVSLDEVRRRHHTLEQAAADGAVMHPALRWISGRNPYAHRRTPGGDTVCGLPGPLVLAGACRDRLCRDCYTVPVAG